VKALKPVVWVPGLEAILRVESRKTAYAFRSLLPEVKVGLKSSQIFQVYDSLKGEAKVGIGLDVKEPEQECQDKHCPFHGNLSVRGSTFIGEVQSTKMQKSATVRWETAENIPKYERKERRNTKITAHVPECLEVEEGDKVGVVESRPISKTKSAAIVQIRNEETEEEVE
jgi:small subunit ribosomal protein S17